MTAPIASGWSESPGGACTHWKAPPLHGARRSQPLAAQRRNHRVHPKPTSIARRAVAASSQSGLAFREGCVREPTELSIGTKQAALQLDVHEPTRARVHRYTCNVKRYAQ